jgi:hypothetical protein
VIDSRFTRRQGLRYLAGVPAADSLLRAQEIIGEPAGRITPLTDLVNIFEVLAMARRKLPENVYSTVAGTVRSSFERITFRPRLMVNVAKLDLTTELLGEKLFAPIIGLHRSLPAPPGIKRHSIRTARLPWSAAPRQQKH